MNILMISPESPPKNSPESIQVGRYLKELEKHHHIELVTTPIERGWVVADKSLQIELENTHIITLHLPLHHISARLLSSRYFARYCIPDKDFWIQLKTSFILKMMQYKPDIIYSRSMPFSSALLALKLKKKTNLPWVMHLSDPFYDNPYRAKSPNYAVILQYEQECFEASDAITLTTKKMLAFYQNKYPQYSDKMSISSNVMPDVPVEIKEKKASISDRVSMVYAGALYGERNLSTLFEALKILKNTKPELLEKLDIKIIGNMAEAIREEIVTKNFSQITLLGRLDYSEVLKIQERSDIVISIEPEGEHPLLKAFLPSKILDYLAANKPILAITPEGSESWDICNHHHFGWAIEPSDSEGLAHLLEELVTSSEKIINLKPNFEILNHYRASECAKELDSVFTKLTKEFNK